MITIQSFLSLVAIFFAIRLGKEFRDPTGTPSEDEVFDFFIFGTSNEIVHALVTNHSNYFQRHVRSLHLVQDTEELPMEYKRFEDITIDVVDYTNPITFESDLKKLVKKYAKDDKPMHVFPTYELYDDVDLAPQKSSSPTPPRFQYNRDSLQINLNARLQILEAFRKHADNTRFHLLGSLFAFLPYMGDYPVSAWYMNNIVADPDNYQYNVFDVALYNLPGVLSWKEGKEETGYGFTQAEIPTKEILKRGFSQRVSGIHTLYPSLISKIIAFFGRRGFKIMDLVN